MELIRGAHNLRSRHRGSVVTIGNFDGVHLGHQAVLGQLAEKGAELGLPTTVVSFEPLPREYFMGGNAPPRLQRFRDKLLAMRRFSVDRLLCLRFNAALAQMSPEDFIRILLVEKLGVRYLVVGDDFRFGRDRRGDFQTLKAAGRQHDFEMAHMHTFHIDGERVSSTRIRHALGLGHMTEAEKLLGRPYRINGRVAHGDKRGRPLGFPTANLRLGPSPMAVRGVYAVEVFGLPGEPLQGVANAGTRPTLGGIQNRLEVHLFDFDGDLYGRHLHVDLLHRLRDEQRFPSLEALREQITLDATQARQFFAAPTPPAPRGTD
ncbi:bifunctional riboflavin kinase/FAD synthetase [Ectothiorhodospira lacustris]|uniref:bifunctional riboflavin kinase/FAD synthetase n=1 Tax=Ectothiorhodospira lacustris TaxID=2899127 RepID=UPI001EE94F57|nr:bifunctional riboflavin kinase/FAD synthetase [Ectothiorhodospira lacustris]MCG5510756.1 bifunctional riboflavin kinase/FAD synthetase [Ectothiorhodospira lacustris]MCG5522488.1 bifunctional riboflavin kinase/FAD synthetase [Ectothiorhodospira lacustris]